MLCLIEYFDLEKKAFRFQQFTRKQAQKSNLRGEKQIAGTDSEGSCKDQLVASVIKGVDVKILHQRVGYVLMVYTKCITCTLLQPPNHHSGYVLLIFLS